MLDEILALHEPTYRAVREVLAGYARGVRLTVDEAAAQAGLVHAAGPTRQPTAAGGAVAVVPLMGLLTYRSSLFSMLFGGTSTATFAAEVRRVASDASVSTIVVPTDSPGGMAAGCEEAAAALADAAKRKRVVAVVDLLAASGAYWIIAGSTEIIASPSAILGSVGAVAVHDDLSGALAQAGVKRTFVFSSRFKVEGNEAEPLSPEARAEVQRRVDAIDAMMSVRIAAGRRVTVERVRSDFGQGRTLFARDAVARGMADRIGTLNELLGRLVSGAASSSSGVSAVSADDDLDRRKRRHALAALSVPLPLADPDLDRRRRRHRNAELTPSRIVQSDADDLDRRRRRHRLAEAKG